MIWHLAHLYRALQEYESQREEIKNRNSEEYNVLKISLEGTITDLENHFDEQHKAYKASTDARTESFRKLTKNDAASARIIERRMRKLIRLQDSLVGPSYPYPLYHII